jgi:hypothetical protein
MDGDVFVYNDLSSIVFRSYADVANQQKGTVIRLVFMTASLMAAASLKPISA